MSGPVQTLMFYDNGGDLHIKLTDLDQGWEVKHGSEKVMF